ncbi:MAG: invasion associated locus B family protein [Rhizobiales bacterium]|nr:invasion associated locus B family protein [Hyphomicrobiales bacterium]
MRSFVRSVSAAAILLATGSLTFAQQQGTQKAFDQWQVVCGQPQGGKAGCILGVSLINNKKETVFQWAITPDRESKGNRLVITTLTGVLIAEGIAVRFGDGEPVRIPYKLCMPKFCAAEIPFTENWLKTFKASKTFAATITAANGKELKYDVSLNQFAAAYDFYVSELAKLN